MFEAIPLADPLRGLDLDLRAARPARRARPGRGRGRVTELSADWVLPVDGPPIKDGRVRFEDGRDRRGRHRPRRAPLRRRGDRAGVRERALAPRVLGVRGLRRRHAVRPLDRAAHGAQGAPQPGGDARGRPARRGRVARVGDHDDGRLQRSRASRRPPPPSSACARSSTSRSSGATRAGRERQFDEKRARLAGEPELVRIGVSPHAPYTCSLDVYRWCLCARASPSARISPRARTRTSGSSTAPGRSRRSRRSCSLRPGCVPSGRSSPCWGPTCCARIASTSTRPRSTCSPSGDVPVAHCPRSNALLGCGIAPLADLRAAGVASASERTRRRRLRRSTSSRRCGPRSTWHAAESAAPMHCLAEDALRLATLEAARAVGLDAQVGTLTPGKRADLTVVSLAESPYHPVEDPAAAVVFGGSPERVLETIVDGQTRYRRGDPSSGKRYAAPQAPPDGECSQPQRVARPRKQAEAAAVAGRALLPAAP